METEIFPTKSYSEIKKGLPASTLKATGGAYDGESENYIVEEMKIYESHGIDARYNERDISPTLASRMGTGGGNVPLKIEKGVCLCQGTGMSRNGPIYKEKTAFTLTSVDRYCTVAIGKDSSHLTAIDVAHTLTAYDYKAQQAVLKRGEAFVRRLTPLECERLQGLPDNWTAYGCDSKRYKAIGNGMAQPCADFVIEKLVEVLKERG
nr:MAG TPA: Cytosine specific methyltransferase [Caudoviricetes sp.]